MKRFLRPTFSLRTLLIIVAVLGVWLGYEMNWIRQRGAFMADQLKRWELAWPGSEHDKVRTEMIVWWKNQQLNADERPAPWHLRLFGEQGVDQLLIIIPEADIQFRNQAYQMSASQADWQRAKSLFPEAEVMPIRWESDIPRETQRAFYEIQIVE